MVVVAGVDVGKANLDVSISEGPVLRFDNTARGITRLLKHLMEQDATMTVCESTGGYERLLVGRLRKAEIAVRVAHPSRGARFRPGLRLRSQNRPQRRSGSVPLRPSLPGCGHTGAGTGARGTAGLAAEAAAVGWNSESRN